MCPVMSITFGCYNLNVKHCTDRHFLNPQWPSENHEIGKELKYIKILQLQCEGMTESPDIQGDF